MTVHCSYYSHQGRYNLMSDEDQVQIVLDLRVGDVRKTISERWDVDRAPDVGGLPPSEVLTLIEDHLKAYLFCTGREQKQETIDWMRQFPATMDHAWAKAQIEQLNRTIKDLEKYVLDEEDLHELARSA